MQTMIPPVDRETQIRGGIRAGIFNATWPLATLTVSRDRLRLKAWGMGEVSFRPDQVIGFKKMFGGCQIYHTLSAGPVPLVFWGDSQRIVNIIQSVGFTPSAQGTPDPFDDTALRSTRALFVIMLLLFVVVTVLAMVCAK